MDPLDRHQKINRTQNRPPAVSCRIHPGEALQPFFAGKRRPVATKTTHLHLKAQQSQPIPQTPVANQFFLGQKRFAQAHAMVQARTLLSQAPQTNRIESTDHHAAFRYQNPLHFTQGGVGINTEFQRVRQNHKIETVGLKGQGREVSQKVDLRREAIVGKPLMGHAVGAQRFKLG